LRVEGRIQKAEKHGKPNAETLKLERAKADMLKAEKLKRGQRCPGSQLQALRNQQFSL
jgi:hypothetical protein